MNESLIERLKVSCLGLDAVDPLRLLVDDVIEALRERAMYEVQRLGQEIEQEPVAWMREDATLRFADGKMFAVGQPFYTHPPQRTWQGLTDEEIIDVIHPLVMADMPDQATDYEIAKAIEAKLKEKNNA